MKKYSENKLFHREIKEHLKKWWYAMFMDW